MSEPYSKLGHDPQGRDVEALARPLIRRDLASIKATLFGDHTANHHLVSAFRATRKGQKRGVQIID